MSGHSLCPWRIVSHPVASADTHWMQTPRSRRIYDYRIRETICETGDRDLFPELRIPRSTVRSWIRRGVPDVVTSDLATRERSDLIPRFGSYSVEWHYSAQWSAY
jgi:hypothetical protein